MDLEQIRREYLLGGLRREHLHDNPFRQFDIWMEQAMASQIPDPTAMVLATVDATGQPDQRIVLLKQADDRGFVFYTNYASKKASDIAANAKVSLHFPWHMMERQVRVNGTATRLSSAESLKYFVSRPPESQLAAWASQQSSRISSRSFLLAQFERMKEKFAEGKIPLPDFWGGYRVVPSRFEFWQGGASRLHDRFEYRMTTSATWDIGRLAP
jgi:pyridoxamine 5'-phosphate oxidase